MLNKKITKVIFTLSIFLMSIFSLLPVSAQDSELWPEIQNQLKPFDPLFGGPVDIRIVIARILKYLLTLVGMIFLCYIVYAGFTWLTAAGNEEKIRKAKSTIVTGAVGMAVIIMAFAIARFVIIAARCATDVSGGWCAFLNDLTW